MPSLPPCNPRSRPIRPSSISTPTSDVERLSVTLAGDPSVSDYAIWRALKTIENDLYDMERRGAPVPIDLLYTRRILAEGLGRRTTSSW